MITRAVAAAVLVLGKDADCPPVRDWAVRLSDEAEGFLLNALETSLGNFPALIASVAARAASPAV